MGAEPSWYRGVPTPYYKQTHADFRAKVRNFVETKLKPNVDDWIESGYPMTLHKEFYDAGLGGILYPEEYGGSLETHDYFHRVILWDELARCGGGMVFAALSVNSMALPPVLFAGSEELKKRVAPDVVRGEKFIALAISEPLAGSDISNMQSTAVRTSDGKSWILNGQKKWISGAAQADYLTVACRTAENAGMMGLSLFVVDAKAKGVSIRKMKTQFDSSHSTCFVTLEDVVVPAEDMIGEENAGFMYLVQNFNKERHTIAISALRQARTCYEEAFRWASNRKTFGKTLISHQLVRYKLAEMLRLMESVQDQVDRIAFMFDQGIPDMEMAIDCSLVKVNASRCFELAAREASQIFGGSSIVREGQGKTVERLYREVRTTNIP